MYILFFPCSNYKVKPLIWVESVVEIYKNSRVEIQCKAKSQFKQRSSANNVQIIVPVPKFAASPKLKVFLTPLSFLILH